MAIQEIISQIEEVLDGFPTILVATLFGSAARDRMSPMSDVDIAVAGAAPLGFETRLELTVALSERLHREVDLVDLQSVSGLIMTEALCKGVLVRNTKPETYAELIKKMWYHEADFMPIYRRIMAERTRRFLQ